MKKTAIITLVSLPCIALVAWLALTTYNEASDYKASEIARETKDSEWRIIIPLGDLCDEHDYPILIVSPWISYQDMSHTESDPEVSHRESSSEKFREWLLDDSE